MESLEGGSFITGAIVACAVLLIVKLVGKKLAQNETYRTPKGISVHDYNSSDRFGYVPDPKDVAKLCDIYWEKALEMGIPKEVLENVSRRISVWWEANPFPVPTREYKSGFVWADTDDNGFMRVGIMPDIEETGFAHELTHNVLRELNKDNKEVQSKSDSDHTQKDYWEGEGLVGRVNAAMKASRQ